MIVRPDRIAALASLLVALGLAAVTPAEAQEVVRVAGMSTTLGATEFEATALVTGRPARVVFEMVPRLVTPVPAPTRVEATRRAARPQAVAAFGPTVAEYAARLPAPARFGSFTGRAIAYDAAGAEVARTEAEWSRSFDARVTITPAAPVLDVSAAPGEAMLQIAVAGAEAISAIAVQTAAHTSAEIGFGELPYEAAQEARAGTSLPPVPIRLTRLAPTRFELRFSVPAATPPRTLSIDRVYLRARSGHYAELTVTDAPSIQVTSTSPQPAALDVRVSRERSDLVVTFRYVGPVLGRARVLYGHPVPNVEVRVRDTIRSVIGRCVPLENPMGDPPWGGEQMTCRLHTATRGGHPLGAAARLQIVARRHPIGEAPLAELLAD